MIGAAVALVISYVLLRGWLGGLGSFLGPLPGAVLLFGLQELCCDFRAWYLAGIGIVAIVFALHAPWGIMGLIADRTGRILRLAAGRATLA